MNQDRAIARHEAGHALGLLVGGYRVASIEVPARVEGLAGRVLLDHEASSPTDRFGLLVATLLGPMAEGRPAPAWPPVPSPWDDDERTCAALVHGLRLSRAEYEAAAATAEQYLAAPEFQDALERVANAILTLGTLSGESVSTALGSRRRWFGLEATV